ncbi:hypothetical protein E2C01_029782 [Portunus trituberculatus]|uniref:Uncharacterized protein n=1 Tax=Portunus trituberculatus TaxID=210409 RepID=A0A5B7ESW7_PORTR|nr:hypothetical protein [Portunus trituberculatus]
MMSCPCGSLW